MQVCKYASMQICKCASFTIYLALQMTLTHSGHEKLKGGCEGACERLNLVFGTAPPWLIDHCLPIWIANRDLSKADCNHQYAHLRLSEEMMKRVLIYFTKKLQYS